MIIILKGYNVEFVNSIKMFLLRKSKGARMVPIDYKYTKDVAKIDFGKTIIWTIPELSLDIDPYNPPKSLKAMLDYTNKNEGFGDIKTSDIIFSDKKKHFDILPTTILGTMQSKGDKIKQEYELKIATSEDDKLCSQINSFIEYDNENEIKLHIIFNNRKIQQKTYIKNVFSDFIDFIDFHIELLNSEEQISDELTITEIDDYTKFSFKNSGYILVNIVNSQLEKIVDINKVMIRAKNIHPLQKEIEIKFKTLSGTANHKKILNDILKAYKKQLKTVKI